MTLDARATHRRTLALVIRWLGALILGGDAAVSIPPALAVLRDPASHEAEDAGLMAVLLLMPIAIVGIAVLALGFLLWRTRAGGTALATAIAVLVLVVPSLGGVPTLLPAIVVAVGGAGLAAWFGYRDSLAA